MQKEHQLHEDQLSDPNRHELLEIQKAMDENRYYMAYLDDEILCIPPSTPRYLVETVKIRKRARNPFLSVKYQELENLNLSNLHELVDQK